MFEFIHNLFSNFDAENDKAPDSQRIKWRLTYKISPAFNLFFYLMMAFYCQTAYLTDYETFKNHPLLETLSSPTNPVGLFLVSLLIGCGISALIGYFLKNSLNSSIKIPPIKQQVLYVLSYEEDSIRFHENEKRYPDTEWTPIPFDDIQSINDLKKYQVVISSRKLDTAIVDALDGYSIFLLDFSEVQGNKDEILVNFLKDTIFKKNAFMTLANIGRTIGHFLEIAISKVAYLTDVLLQNETFRILIILLFLGSSGTLAWFIFHNPLLLKMSLVLLGSGIVSILKFNIFFLLLFQMDNIAILITNLLTELLPYCKLHTMLSKLDNTTTFSEWYEEHLDKFLTGDEEANPLGLLKKGDLFYAIMGATIMLLANVTRLLFKIVIVPVLGSFTVKTVYKLLYIPMHIVMLALFIIHYLVGSYLFAYSLIFFFISLVFAAISAVLFESSIAFIFESMFASDLMTLEKIVLTILGLLFFILSVFLGQNILTVITKTGSYRYYFGAEHSQGVVQKMLLNWRKGIYKTQIKASLWTGLVASLIMGFSFLGNYMNNDYPNLNYSKITEVKATIKSKVKGYELNPRKFKENVVRDIKQLFDSLTPERLQKQIEEVKIKGKK